MGTPAEDAAYQRARTEYRVWCQSVGQMPDPGYLEELARLYNQGLHAPGMGPATPQPTAPVVPGGGAPAIPAAPEATPTGQAPGSWDDLRAMFPQYDDQQWKGLVNTLESMGLDYQTGFKWIEMAVQTGLDLQIAEWDHEVGMLNAEANQISAEAAALNAETNRLYSMGMLEEAKLSREQELLMSRELNELNKYIAEMVNQVATLGLQIQERAYGAQLGAHPVNTVEYELWKRAGGRVEPVEIPEAPVPQAPIVPGATAAQAAPAAPAIPTAPTAPAAPTDLQVFSPQGNVPVRTAARGTVARPGELHTTGEEGWEYLHPGPGTVVAPRAKGETQPTQEGGARAIGRQVSQGGGGSLNVYRPSTVKSKARIPYRWLERLQARKSVPSMQGGGQTHTDEEMAEMFAGAIKGWPHLYNPKLGGVGQFGATIPGPQEMGRRRYYSMDPSEHDILTSFLTGGLKMPSGEMGASIAEDWLRQMQRSWIPGLEGAKKAVSYAY